MQQLARPAGAVATAHQMMLQSSSSSSSSSGGSSDAARKGYAHGAGISCSGSSSSSSLSVHPWDAAVNAAAALDSSAKGSIPRPSSGPPLQTQTQQSTGRLSSISAGGSCSSSSALQVIDFGAPQSGAIRDAACSLLMASLDRARRMGGLKAMQVRLMPTRPSMQVRPMWGLSGSGLQVCLTIFIFTHICAV
jgi:hypothetical protein